MPSPLTVQLADYSIGEARFEAVASEFFAVVMFPAGNHQVAHVEYPKVQADDVGRIHAAFLAALESYRRKK